MISEKRQNEEDEAEVELKRKVGEIKIEIIELVVSDFSSDSDDERVEMEVEPTTIHLLNQGHKKWRNEGLVKKFELLKQFDIKPPGIKNPNFKSISRYHD